MKPVIVIDLHGADGNIFNILAVARDALHKNKLNKEAEEMIEKAMSSGSYDAALEVIRKYVELVFDNCYTNATRWYSRNNDKVKWYWL